MAELLLLITLVGPWLIALPLLMISQDGKP